MRVAVIDYGSGNLGSMLRALEELGARPQLATDPGMIDGAERLILPGVGSFSDCMLALAASGWPDALAEATQGRGMPLLGVCVGMQLLACRGDEGASGPEGTPGLGFVPGRVRHLRNMGCAERLPHVGWNAISLPAAPDPLLAGIPDGTSLYFVHSFAMQPDNTAHVIATARHGIDFVAAVRAGHVWGTQFHPEKSSRAGLRVLRNFLGAAPC